MSVADKITEAFNALNKERLVCKGCGRFNNFCMCKEQKPMKKEQIDYETMTILLADPIMCGIIQTLCKQTQKGVKTYGHTLSDCPDEKFDWRLMAMEEMIDCIQYQQKEIIRLEKLLNP